MPIPHTKLTQDHEKMLVLAYMTCTLAVDRLPYTPEMEKLYAEFIIVCKTPYLINTVYAALVRLRKNGELGRKSTIPFVRQYREH